MIPSPTDSLTGPGGSQIELTTVDAPVSGQTSVVTGDPMLNAGASGATPADRITSISPSSLTISIPISIRTREVRPSTSAEPVIPKEIDTIFGLGEEPVIEQRYHQEVMASLDQTNDLSTLTLKVQMYEHQLQESRAKHRQTFDTMEKYKLLAEEQESSNSRIKSDLEQERTIFKNQISLYAKQLAAKEAELKVQSGVMADLRNSKEQLEKSKKQTGKRLVETIMHLANAKTESQKLTRRNEELEVASQELESYKEEYIGLESTLARLSFDTEKRRTLLQNQISKQTEQNQANTDALEQTQKELAEKSERCESQRKSIRKLVAEALKYAQQIGKLKEELQTKEAEAERSSEKILTLEQKITDLQAELQSLKGTLDQQTETQLQQKDHLEQKLSANREQLAEKTAALQNRDIELETVKARLAAVDQQRAELTQEHQQSTQKISRLEAEITNLTEQQATLKAQLEELRQIVDETRSSKTDLELQVSQLQSQLESLQPAPSAASQSPGHRLSQDQNRPGPSNLDTGNIVVVPSSEVDDSASFSSPGLQMDLTLPGSSGDEGEGDEVSSTTGCVLASGLVPGLSEPRHLSPDSAGFPLTSVKQVFDHARELNIPQEYVALGYPIKTGVDGKPVTVNSEDDLGDPLKFNFKDERKILDRIRRQFIPQEKSAQSLLQQEGVRRVWVQAAFLEFFAFVKVLGHWLVLPHTEAVGKLHAMKTVPHSKLFTATERAQIQQWQIDQRKAEKDKKFEPPFCVLDWLTKLAKAVRDNPDDKLVQLAGCWADLSIQMAIAELPTKKQAFYQSNDNRFDWRKLDQESFPEETPSVSRKRGATGKGKGKGKGKGPAAKRKK